MTEEPDKAPNLYREWLAEKRSLSAPDEMAERVERQLLIPQSSSEHAPTIPQWARAAVLIAAAVGGLGRYVLLGILILIS